MFKKILPIAALAAICISSISAQEPTYIRDYCVKVKPGRAAEFTERLHEVGQS